jgi:deoxyribose-phosphate aldolase
MQDMEASIRQKLEEGVLSFRGRYLQNGIEALRIDKHPIEGTIARYIDHTLLKPEATVQDVETLCEEARSYSFVSVCVNPSFVHRCTELLGGTETVVCTVIGFPLGSNTTEIKVAETEQAIHNGAREIDMVLHIGMLKSGEYDYVYSDIAQITETAHRSDVLVKVIIETALLTEDEKIRACLLAKWAGTDFVKTSTGFGTGGATVPDIRLMRAVVGPHLGVKASGGIRTRKSAEEMIRNGATRIGASASVSIVREHIE